MAAERDALLAPPDSVGPGQAFIDVPDAQPGVFLYEDPMSRYDRYVRYVAENSCDPGARRALQIMHGLGACAGGDRLLLGVCDNIAEKIGWWTLQEIDEQTKGALIAEESPSQ